MWIQKSREQLALGVALIVLGLSLGVAAAVAGLLAFDHMVRAMEMCGPTSGHCLRCVAAAALSIAALGACIAGLWLRRSVAAPQRAC